MPRLVGWLMGLLLYGVASGLKIVGFNLGPFTVLASVFTTLLVFNLVFAHWLLGESVTREKVSIRVRVRVRVRVRGERHAREGRQLMPPNLHPD